MVIIKAVVALYRNRICIVAIVGLILLWVQIRRPDINAVGHRLRCINCNLRSYGQCNCLSRCDVLISCNRSRISITCSNAIPTGYFIASYRQSITWTLVQSDNLSIGNNVRTVIGNGQCKRCAFSGCYTGFICNFLNTQWQLAVRYNMIDTDIWCYTYTKQPTQSYSNFVNIIFIIPNRNGNRTAAAQ